MNAEDFKNILACIESMNDVQTSTLLQAVLKQKQMIPILSFRKQDIDDVDEANGDKPLTDEEWDYLDNTVKDDTFVADMTAPIYDWFQEKVIDVKQHEWDMEEVDMNCVEDVHNDVTLSESIPASSIKLSKHFLKVKDSRIENICNVKNVRLSRTTDELAVIACSPYSHKQTDPVCSKFNFWLLSFHTLPLY